MRTSKQLKIPTVLYTAHGMWLKLGKPMQDFTAIMYAPHLPVKHLQRITLTPKVNDKGKLEFAAYNSFGYADLALNQGYLYDANISVCVTKPKSKA